MKKFLLDLDLQQFAEGDPPAGGTDPGATPPPTDPPAGGATPPANPEPPANPTPPATPTEKPVQMTQAQLDALIADRLRRDREAKGYDKLAEDAKKWEEYNRTQKTDFENLQTDYQKIQQDFLKLQTELSTTKVEGIKTEVLTELGLPLTLKTRVQGSTLEEIKADAEALRDIMGITNQPKPPVGGGTNPPSPGGNQIFTRAQLDQMSPAEVNQNWNAIQDQLKRGLIK